MDYDRKWGMTSHASALFVHNFTALTSQRSSVATWLAAPVSRCMRLGSGGVFNGGVFNVQMQKMGMMEKHCYVVKHKLWYLIS